MLFESFGDLILKIHAPKMKLKDLVTVQDINALVAFLGPKIPKNPQTAMSPWVFEHQVRPNVAVRNPPGSDTIHHQTSSPHDQRLHNSPGKTSTQMAPVKQRKFVFIHSESGKKGRRTLM